MSRFRKSIAIVSAAAPVVLLGSAAMAGVNAVSLGAPTAAETSWPNSPTYNTAPVIDSGDNGLVGAPSNQGAGPGIPVAPGSAAGESFTTGANGFSLGAITLEFSANTSTVTPQVSLHLFQLGNGYVPTGGTFSLGPAASGQTPVTPNVEIGNDLLGGGAGLTYSVGLGGSPNVLLEFDLSGADQVALLPNTSYYFELWNIDQADSFTFNIQRQGGTPTYTGGQVYSTTDPNPNNVEMDHSGSTRNQSSAGQRTAMFAIYSNVVATPIPTWSTTGSGDWNFAGNWSAPIPNAVGAEADFFGAITANHTVFTDIAETVGTIKFNNANTYVLAGAGSLTLQVSSGSALVDVQNPTSGPVKPVTEEINLPLTIASNTTFNVAANTTLNISDPITINSGETLSKTGTGSVVYQSTITVQTGGVINFASPTVAHSLALVGSALATVPAHGVNPINLLQLDSFSPGSGELDLTTNALIVHNGNLGSVNTPGSIASELKAGFNAAGGYWNGTGGIVSTSAANDTRFLTTLGYRQGTGSLIDGISTASTDVLVKYTYYGDADLSGTVDGSDYHQIDLGFGSQGTANPLTGWQNGDFNYDGVVNGADYALIDNTFNQLVATGAGPLALVALPSADVSAVPEPTVLGLLGIGAMTLLGRRRRNFSSVI